MQEVVIEVRGLCVRRDGVQVLDGIDWRVGANEHWVILGANGSGKTSLLKVLLAYLAPTRGTIVVLGHEYGTTDWRELRRTVGLVGPAVPELMPEHEPGLSVIASGQRAQIGSWGAPEPAVEERARALLARVECERLERRPWRVLSQGERQRLLIGRALMSDPRLLILDEPCAGLDPAAREHFLEFVDRLGRGGEAAPNLVLVTHHVEEITDVYTHVLLLAGGCVHRQGRKQEMVTSPLLSEVFTTPLTVRSRAGRYTLELLPGAGHGAGEPPVV